MINTAIGILEINKCILMIKREKGLFKGLWGLPGGKLELNEHIDEAAEREFYEEANVKVNFVELLGVVSEIVKEEEIVNHTLLYCCKLTTDVKCDISNSSLSLIPIDEIHSRTDIIASDKIILDKMYLHSKKRNYLKIISVNNNGIYDATEI